MRDFDEKMFSGHSNISGIDRLSTHGGVEEKYWLNLDGVEYLFKIDRDRHFGFGELFTSHMARLLGISCVNCYPAEDREMEKRGVLIECFFEKKEQRSLSLEDLIDSCRDFRKPVFDEFFSLSDLLELEEQLKEKGMVFDDSVKEDFKKMAFLDFLLCQIDRHSRNVEFLVWERDGKKVLTLAPMFDNGRCLGLWNIKKDAQATVNTCIPRLSLTSLPLNHRLIEHFEIENDFARGVLRDKTLRDQYKKTLSLDIKRELEYVRRETFSNISDQEIAHMEKIYSLRLIGLERRIADIAKKGDDTREKVAELSERYKYDDDEEDYYSDTSTI